MKRRRQTLKQVLARHAVEEAMNDRRNGGGYRTYKGRHQPRLSRSVSNKLMQGLLERERDSGGRGVT